MKKHVLIGISGGIAAYKSLTLIRSFVKNDYEVKVVATDHALEFVTPLTIETLSGNKLYNNMFQTGQERTTEHIALAQWADVFVVAPATANIIGKYAHGLADDALSTTLLAYKKILFMAPAMNDAMWDNEAVQANLKILQNRGVKILEPGSGFLACNSEGKGRMMEPEKIFEAIDNYLCGKNSGLRALVSAGGTQEPIDAVRYIGNRSSGLMGFCLAESLAQKGVQVDLISGPTSLTTHHPLIHRIDVQTAADMLQACQMVASQVDIIIMAAAVADYTPEHAVDYKVKKTDATWQIHLKPTEDILKTLSLHRANDRQIVVGFALETNDEKENAIKKLKTKQLDMIVLNSLNDKGAGFSTSTNKVLLIDKNEQVIDIPLQSKQAVAEEIVSQILKKINHHE
ncbi:MAG: bifunctional phosphopantothenoylcysteine decarboxylase/phosphopantothenate--cysteine ligase CoaBC [Bacteroidales bacterium]|jgi:phosphopantothenoylcysteine decarboxylase/phosphopantothenate--cysteine ligase|nr:bifunctional phosphopantothenoylcysteine decarboxylase/phosphopantothenate--cysteine ligase CoaBC [Bacteroidales bacterium]MBR4454217.1 bifunctional phosphopantothenoylcysteine decarboxylase/phosphopantothenate--cysteine ligase CoaBC [Bacteroidales bacterium]